jgi:hypothetical protein
VGMIQRRHGAGFPPEPLGELGGGDLDGNDAVRAGVAGLVDFAHATGADGRNNLVRTEFRAALQARDRIPSALPVARPGEGAERRRREHNKI